MNKIGGIGILGILLFAALFSCGCIDTAPAQIVEVDKIVEVEKIVYIDNYDEGYNAGWNDMVVKYNKDMIEVNNKWKKIVEQRDNEWKILAQNAYKQGWNDAVDNTVTDVFYVVKDLTPILKWIPI